MNGANGRASNMFSLLFEALLVLNQFGLGRMYQAASSDVVRSSPHMQTSPHARDRQSREQRVVSKSSSLTPRRHCVVCVYTCAMASTLWIGV
jgi:hypothetical protein